MEIMILDFNLFPALIYNFILFIFVRLILINVKYKKGKSFVAMTIAGALGFFMFAAFPFYAPFFKNYLLVPVLFFITFIIGLSFCFGLNINPFIPDKPLYIKRKVIKKSEENIPNNTEVFTPIINSNNHPIEESLGVIDKELSKLEPPFFVYKELYLKFMSEKLDYYFFLITPNGLFHVYPCNWKGNIKFTNGGSVKEIKSNLDTKDFLIAASYREQLIRLFLKSLGMEDIKVHTVICLTNPEANIISKPSNYKVTTLDTLIDTIQQEVRDTNTIDPAILSDLKTAFQSIAQKKK